MVLRNRVSIAIASIVWLLWRSGTQPRRLGYPCQQAAAANLGFLAVLFVPALARRRSGAGKRNWSAGAQLAAGSVLLGGVLVVLISAGVAVYSDYFQAAAAAGTPALISWTRITDADMAVQAALSSRVPAPSGQEAIVAINRNNSVTYGTLPYGPGTNTAYNLAKQTVADLHLGPASNPLASMVSDVNGDGKVSVVLKPNWVEYYSVRAGGEGDAEGRSPAYTHPAMMRPLADMAIQAGATELIIGDSSGEPNNPNTTAMGYTDLVNSLRVIYPTISILLVNFQNPTKFSWVQLPAGTGGPSAYAGSGYTSNDLLKAHTNATYWSTADPHGKAGPGEANCMGWYALTDYLLNADLIVDMAKMKVHFYGVNTMAIKNWVGTTMLSTFDMSGIGWCRISHELNSIPGDYERMWGNDCIWREVQDLHRAFLYWKRNANPATGGTIQSTQQRKYLCVVDAIVCGETDLYYNGGPRHWRANTILASTDPVAVDSVGSRVQRYKFDRIPIVNNANQASAWPIGTGDPAKVRVVGGTMIDGTTYSRVSDFDDLYDSSRTWPDWSQATVSDITPPVIHSASAVDQGNGTWRIQANISGAHVAFAYYGDDNGAPYAVRLAKSGENFSAVVSGLAGNGAVVAQDTYFNTARAEFVNLPSIRLNPEVFEHSFFVGGSPDDETFTVTNVGIGTLNYTIESDQTWVSVDPDDGTSTGEPDTITVHYTCGAVPPGQHVAHIRVLDPGASNSPQTVTVTIHVGKVKPDFDSDGDVDQADFGWFQQCLSGQGVLPVAGCEAARLDVDTDVDRTDLEIFENCLSGAGVLATEGCDTAP